MNIIILAAVDLPEGGGETTRLKTLVQAVKAAGHEVRILLENTSGNVDPNLLQPKGETGGIPFEYILGHTRPLQGKEFFTAKWQAVRSFIKRLNELHRQQPVDVVWFNMLAAHTIGPVSRWAKKNGVRIIHSYEDERIKGPGLKRQLIYWNQRIADKYLTRQADALVVISTYLKNKYEKLTYGKVPIYLIPTVVEADKWLAEDMPKLNPPIALYYGSFYGFDEVEKMIDAIGVLRDRHKPVKLYLVGYNRRKPEYMEEIAARVRTKGLEQFVELKGFTPHHRLMDYINEAAMLLALRKDDPWSSTGLSTKLSEYLSTGRPVIASALGDNTFYLKNEESALLLRPGCSADELADAMQRLAEEQELRQRIGQAGREVALGHFAVEVVQKKIGEMLRKLRVESFKLKVG